MSLVSYNRYRQRAYRRLAQLHSEEFDFLFLLEGAAEGDTVQVETIRDLRRALRRPEPFIAFPKEPR